MLVAACWFAGLLVLRERYHVLHFYFNSHPTPHPPTPPTNVTPTHLSQPTYHCHPPATVTHTHTPHQFDITPTKGWEVWRRAYGAQAGRLSDPDTARCCLTGPR